MAHGSKEVENHCLKVTRQSQWQMDFEISVSSLTHTKYQRTWQFAEEYFHIEFDGVNSNSFS